MYQLDAGDKPTLYVFNKCDRLEIVPSSDVLKNHDSVCISAKTGAGVDNLLSMIDEILAKSKKQIKFLFPYNKQSAVNNLYENATVLSTEYVDAGVLVEAIVDSKCYGMYENFVFEE